MTTEASHDYPFSRTEPLAPPAEWAQLRGRCPVAHVRVPSGDVVGLVSGYDDVRAVISDPRFTRNLARPGAARLATTEDGGLFSRVRPETVNITEGAGHRRWRRLISGAFTIRKMEAWRPRVQEFTDELVDGMLAKGEIGRASCRERV